MEKIFINACRNNNIKYITVMMNKYINCIYFISKINNVLVDTVHTKVNISYIIDRTNKNNDNIKLQLRKLALKQAVLLGDMKIVKCLFEYQYNEILMYDNEKLLTYSVEKGHIKIIKYILDCNRNSTDIINIHINNDYLFFVACQYKYVDTMNCLIEYSEKINKKYDINYRDYYFITCPNICLICKNCKKYDAIRYILYLKKHNYNNCAFEIPARSECFNYKYINMNYIINKITNVCIYNNIIIYVKCLDTIPNKYSQYCLFIKKI